MEFFAKKFSGFGQVTSFLNSSILDIWQGPKYVSENFPLITVYLSNSLFSYPTRR